MDFLLKFILTLFIMKWVFTFFRLLFDHKYWAIYQINGSRFSYGILDVLGIVSLILLCKR